MADPTYDKLLGLIQKQILAHPHLDGTAGAPEATKESHEGRSEEQGG